MDKEEARIVAIALAVQVSKLLDFANGPLLESTTDLAEKKVKRLHDLIEELKDAPD